jgi:hypothetical protein
MDKYYRLHKSNEVVGFKRLTWHSGKAATEYTTLNGTYWQDEPLKYDNAYFITTPPQGIEKRKHK